MKHIEENEFLNNLANEFKIKIPNKFSDLSIYKEIKKFKDAEYIYCIAYEMLIRTDEYNKLLQSYKSLRNKSKYDMTNDEFAYNGEFEQCFQKYLNTFCKNIF